MARNPWRLSSPRRRPLRRRRLAPIFRPALEALEGRFLLSVRIWSGASGLNANWTNGFNWQGLTPPLPGDDLVFDGSAAQLTNTNDFPANTSFRSLSFTGFGGSADLKGN